MFILFCIFNQIKQIRYYDDGIKIGFNDVRTANICMNVSV